MKKIPFNKDELKVVSEVPGFTGEMLPIYNFPISMRESAVATFRDKDPVWIMTDIEMNTFTPSIFPDNGARGFVFEGGEPDRKSVV